ncbi:MAG: dTMP kinase [Gemmatimonadota bacterium]
MGFVNPSYDDAVPQRGEGGLFLAFEGVEGSGKSTQAGLLADYLRGRDVEVVHVREPGSTPLGERVRSLVLEEVELGIPPWSELFLMLAARAAFLDQVVLPSLAAGRVVIADRFELSTLAYQGAGRGLPLAEVARCNRFATRGVSPDGTVFLELPSDEGSRRQIAAAKRPDRMEQEAREFHERVARGYQEITANVDGLLKVDASGSIQEVQRRVMAALGQRFPETFAPGGFIS